MSNPTIDAVASRDLVLRLLSGTSILGITLSRFATDLLLWSTAEFGLISLSDQLVGSSSMMPQNRNPFILEHAQGRSAATLGVFVSAATAMHSKPFSNSVADGSEAAMQNNPLTRSHANIQELNRPTTLSLYTPTETKQIKPEQSNRAKYY